MMRILIGYDGSEFSDAIFGDLKLAGLPRESDVKVVTVADLLMSGPPPLEIAEQLFTSSRIAKGLQRAQTHAERLTSEAKQFAADAVDRVRTDFPEWRVTSDVMNGTPEWELLDVANEWNADLVVVGSHGRSALKRLFLGSVSKTLATNARCSVRVVRGAVRDDADAPPRIIVGVDGSPAAEEAIHAVGQRVWPEGTEVRLITVDDSTRPTQIATRLPQAAAMINSYFNSRGTRVSSMLEWAKEQLNVIGLKTSVVEEKGDPQTVILEDARKWKADSIFIGTRDFKSAFERFRLGSVSAGVVTQAPCSVEIVRPPYVPEQ